MVNTLIDFLSLFGLETESFITQAILEAPILLPRLPKFWDYRCASSYPPQDVLILIDTSELKL